MQSTFTESFSIGLPKIAIFGMTAVLHAWYRTESAAPKFRGVGRTPRAGACAQSSADIAALKALRHPKIQGFRGGQLWNSTSRKGGEKWDTLTVDMTPAKSRFLTAEADSE